MTTPKSKPKPKTCAEAVAAMPFKVGDVVSIKSGGPAMTVRWLIPEGVECIWFPSADVLESECFPPECLRPFRGQAEDIPF